MTKSQLVTTAFVTGILAAVGALASAYDVERGVDVSVWAARSCAALGAIVFVLFSDESPGGESIGRRPRLLSALLVALLFPYGAESVAHSIGSDMVIFATVVAFALARRRGAPPLAGVVVVGWCAAGLFLLFCRAGGGLAGVHRDLTILLPLLLLGAAGFAKARSEKIESNKSSSYMLSWTAIALACLCLLIMGLPLDVRLCVLPVLWWVPLGVAELGAITIGSQRKYPPLRAVGILSTVVVGCLLYPSVLRWLDGPLIAVYFLAG